MKDSEQKYITDLFKARFPFLYISSWEEVRIIETLYHMVSNADLIRTTREMFVWSQTTGFVTYPEMEYIEDTEQPLKALAYMETYGNPALFILKDFNVYFGVKGTNMDPVVVRKCRDLVVALKGKYAPQNVVIIASSVTLPESLQKDVVVYDYELPSFDDILELLNGMIDVNKDNKNIAVNISEEDKTTLCKAALGLTLQEAENAFARAIVNDGHLSIADLEIIHEEKCQVIRKTEILEYIKTDIKMEDVGGLDNLKKWLKKRNKSWLETAQQYGLPAPKGVLVTGVPGCGKSLCAKAISAVWQLPLLRLDIGKVFSGVVGSSEQNMRKAIQTAEAVAPCILWVDELEKGLSNTKSAGDSGTSARIFGTFLTWMQEKTKPVFVVATSNDISSLPAELLRKGRFDEIFFVDLPTESERKEIFELHLKKRLKNDFISGEMPITDELLTSLAIKTEGFSGAEIEQIVIEGLFEAFSEERPLLKDDLYKAISNAVALSVTQTEQIAMIREWAGTRAVAASVIKETEKYQRVLPDTKTSEKENSLAKVSNVRGGRFVDM